MRQARRSSGRGNLAAMLVPSTHPYRLAPVNIAGKNMVSGW
jgi:hypothetical protein